jgi:hypothetical protein
MTDHKSRTTRAPVAFQLYQQGNDHRRSQLAAERHILELISLGAPLPGILNKLCTAIDVQIGNAVSLFLLPDGTETHLCSVTQSATQVGLHLFAIADILTRDKAPLGTLEIYCCDPRRPTPHEHRLMERVVYLAAIAIQRHGDEAELERASRSPRDGVDVAPERPPFIN